MKIEITDKELNDIFKDKILQHFKHEINDGHLIEYWVREEIHKILAKETVEKFIKNNFDHDKLKQILKEAFENHVREKFE